MRCGKKWEGGSRKKEGMTRWKLKERAGVPWGGGGGEGEEGTDLVTRSREESLEGRRKKSEGEGRV